MIPVLSRDQMRAFDAHAIGPCRVPSLVLMENAGRGAADLVVHEMLGGSARDKRVVVVCGPGNNGGDGFVVARHLHGRGAHVVAWLAGDAARLTPDCAANHAAFLGIGGRVEGVPLGGSLAALREQVEAADVVVDALFGTGLDRPIVAPFAGVVETLGASARVVSLDVPSGMDADTGASLGAMMHAQLTVTFAHLKLGHVTGHGARACGRVRVVDIGVPPGLRAEHAAAIVERSDVRKWLSPRPVDAHKYRAGHVAILAGSAGKVGASLLAAQGALRGGAGAATIVTWPDAASALDSRVVEIMTTRIDEGELLGDQIDAALVHKRAVVIGPGFGTGAGARAAVRHVLATYTGAMVADADALTIQAGALEDFRACSGRAILTPHAGELARLLGKTSEEIEHDRFGAAREAALRAQAVVLLKGPHTVVAAPDGRLVVNATGNPALATAGAGDVLAGLAGALACSMPPFEAAFCAAHLHGAAADAWAARHADRGLLASEVAGELPAAIAAAAHG